MPGRQRQARIWPHLIHGSYAALGVGCAVTGFMLLTPGVPSSCIRPWSTPFPCLLTPGRPDDSLKTIRLHIHKSCG